MHGQLTRHSVQVLLAAGHSQQEVARHASVSVRSVRRIAQEQPVIHADDNAERQCRRVGRPSKAEPYRQFVLEPLDKEPHLMSLEVLRRSRERGYEGGKTAMYSFDRQDQTRIGGLPDAIRRRAR